MVQKAGPGAAVTRTARERSDLAVAGRQRRRPHARGCREPSAADVTGVSGARSRTGTVRRTTTAPNTSSTHGVSRVAPATSWVARSTSPVSARPRDQREHGLARRSSGSLTVPIAAGEVKFVGVAGRTSRRTACTRVQYQDTEIEVQKCGGYAQARSYTVVEIVGNDYSKTTLYGAAVQHRLIRASSALPFVHPFARGDASSPYPERGTMNSPRRPASRAQGRRVGAAAAVAIGFFSAGAANADTFVPLPGGTITQTLADGTVVTVTMTDESANISRRWARPRCTATCGLRLGEGRRPSGRRRRRGRRHRARLHRGLPARLRRRGRR